MPKDLKSKVKQFFIDNAPNAIDLLILENLFENQKDRLYETLKALEDESFLSKETRRHRVVDFQVTVFRICDHDLLSKLPIQKEIEIGDTRIPRQIEGAVATAESINAAVVATKRALLKTENDLRLIFEKQLNKFWGTFVGLVGLLLTLITMISFVGLQQKELILISQKNNWGWYELLINSAASLIPFTVVLLGFSIFLYFLFKK